jgi:hypothetical protein
MGFDAEAFVDELFGERRRGCAAARRGITEAAVHVGSVEADGLHGHGYSVTACS